MHYVSEGRGEVVLMLHGNPTWSFLYRNLILQLRDHFRCIAPDHIGCGLSDKPQKYPYCLQTHIDNAIELVKHLNIKHFHIVVHDWGGAIGMAVAQKFPARLRSIVVLNSAAFLSQQIPLRIAFCRIPILGKFLIRGLNLFSRMANVMATVDRLSSSVKKGFIFPYDSWKNRIAVHEFIKDIPLHPDHPSYGCLDTIQNTLWLLQHKPSLICWGMRDFCFTPHFLEQWKSHFPKALVHRYPNAGHYVLEDTANDSLPRIRQFLLANNVVEVFR